MSVITSADDECTVQYIATLVTFRLMLAKQSVI